MIKLITFDLWNTLVSGSNIDTQRAYRIERISQFLKEENIKIEKERIENAIIEAWKYFMVEWENKNYTPTTYAMVEVIFDALKLDYEKYLFNKIHEFMEQSLLDMDNKLVEGIEDLIKELYGDYILAIISDTGFTPGKYLRILLKQMNIYQYFSLFAFSDEIGVSKPDKRIFQYVLQYFDVEPDQAIHVGDLIRTDVVGSKNAGMKSIRFNKEQYINEEKINDEYFDTKCTKDILSFIKNN